MCKDMSQFAKTSFERSPKKGQRIGHEMATMPVNCGMGNMVPFLSTYTWLPKHSLYGILHPVMHGTVA